MPKLTSAEIRQQFLDFFAGKGHTIVPSASLIPHNDPTLLFTNAGMNQFKDVFLGAGNRPYTRAADTQKCMRVSGKHNDLEDVGKSPYHHTFFEMLGNWSFGDYYKKEAIQWAWELLTDVWQLPKQNLYASVFEDDQGDLGRDTEAADYWLQVTDINPDHVLFFGRKDNFWEMGETGPCGPCSEIHLDRGPDFCELQGIPHKCEVNGECSRYVELWNLVFIQYNNHGGGRLEPLPAKHVDTGMGFERIVSVLQEKHSNYDTDLFSGTIAHIQELLGQNQQQAQQNRVAYRVIADHARAAAFLIADGALPGNVGRNYVLRMIIRRAARFGKGLGFTGPFLGQVAAMFVEEMGAFFSELVEQQEHILHTLTDEEQRFQRTLDTALTHLNDVLAELAAAGGKEIDGETAFDLYATYGLPWEITRDLAEEQGYTVDEAGFKAAQETHRLASGAGGIGAIDTDQLAHYAKLLETLVAQNLLTAEGVDHDPYGDLTLKTRLLALLQAGEMVDSAAAGTEVEVVLAATPFYVEAGGQVSDTGTIAHPLNGKITISEAQMPVAGLIIHRGQVTQGKLQVGDAVTVSVDADRRWDIMRNHTATHLFHRELRRVLGNHVQQKGSLVAPDRFRFDFNHSSMVTAEELNTIEQGVNQAILNNYPVNASHTTLDDAKRRGAMALFGEKYGDIVRTIQVGNPDAPYSLELCGGTHINETAEIGLFHIVSEGSVGANLRRVEAVTGRRAQALAQQNLRIVSQAAATLNTTPAELETKLHALLEEVQAAQKEIARLQRKVAHTDFQRMMQNNVQQAAGVPVLTAVVENATVDTLREMADWFRDKVGSGVAALGTALDDRPLLIVAVTPDLVGRGLKAGDLIRPAAQLIGGGGGGKPTLAQAGGRDATQLPAAVALVPQLVQTALA